MRPSAAVSFAMLALSVCAARTDSSPAAPFRISGEVVEAGTNRPLNDVEIKLVAEPDIVILTNSAGAFEFPLENAGTYNIVASKKGYLALQSGSFVSRAYVNLTLDSAHAARTARIVMAQPVSISGTVLDDITRKPIANMQVSIVQMVLLGWNRTPLPMFPVTTDAQGHFFHNNLPPGRYMVRTLGRRLRTLAHFSESDRNLIEDDYDQTTYPGGGDDSMASPVDIPPGAVMDLGKLALKKIAYHRVHVAFAPSLCENGDTVTLEEVSRTPLVRMTTNLGNVACGKDFLLDAYRPGEYVLQAWIRKAADSVERALATVSVHDDDRNPSVTLSLPARADLNGTIAVERDAAMPPLDEINVRLQFLSRNHLGERDVRPDAAGRFSLQDVPGPDAAVLLSGVKPPFYVKSARYNGRVVNVEGLVELDPQATSHALEFLIDDKAASLYGRVMRKDQPVAEPYVLLVRVPGTGGATNRASGDADGQFRVTGVIPGEYRALAVAGEDRDRIRDPEVLARALGYAQRIEISPGAMQRVMLELVDLNR